MKEKTIDGILFSFVIVLVLLFVVGMPIGISFASEEKGMKEGIYQTQAEAVKLGYGTFAVDEKGKIRFEWKAKDQMFSDLLSDQIGKQTEQKIEKNSTKN